MLTQELIIHIFAPVEGPFAQAAYAELRRIWAGCRTQLGMTQPVAELTLPAELPESLDAALAGSAEEAPLAAQERAGTLCQAVLRRHHDIVNLSIALAAGFGDSPKGYRWADLDDRIGAVVEQPAPVLIGSVRIYQGTVAQVSAATDAETARSLEPLLPEVPAADRWWLDGVATPDGFGVWELSRRDDGRAERRLVILAPGSLDAELSAWTWSSGDPAIPPFARYLLHAAKVRYQLRVRAAADDPSGRWFAAEIADRLASTEHAATLTDERALAELTGKLTLMRQAVEIARSNMQASFGRDAPVLLSGAGPLADDARLAEFFITYVDDDLARLGGVAELASSLADIRRRHPLATPAAARASGPRRRVLVNFGPAEVHARMRDFLRHLDLDPLERDECRELTGQATPPLIDAYLAGAAHAHAAVIVLTPDDVVQPWGTDQTSLQAQPSAFVLLGMALALYRERTVIVLAGAVQLPEQLAGLDHVALDNSPQCRHTIASRLKTAGCEVRQDGTGWLSPHLFEHLAINARQTPS